MEPIHPPRSLDMQGFIKEVEKRPSIWNLSQAKDDKHKRGVAVAWREVCRLTWPEFDNWSPDVKRVMCLHLQKEWKELITLFEKEYRKIGQQNSGNLTNGVNFQSLTFLIPTLSTYEKSPVKRPRTDQCTCDVEEDKLFLLSLVSHMRDVPKNKKLALRSEMLQLVAKYNPTSSEQS